MTEHKTLNQNGYALVAMVFILVSFIAIVFVAVYPLLRTVRENATFFIRERNNYRARKAEFGGLIDQSGTKLVHNRAYFGDYPGWGMCRGTTCGRKKFTSRVMARRVRGHGNTGARYVSYDYRFKDFFWSGYYGKRYVHILPSDDWNYTSYLPYNQANMIDLLVRPGGCGGIPVHWNYILKTGYRPSPPRYVNVVVKDYSVNRANHDLRLVSLGARNTATSWGMKREGSLFFREAARTRSDDYVRYTFEQIINSSSSLPKQIYYGVGQKKLMILVREDPAGPWVLRDTRYLVIPPDFNNFKTPSPTTFKVNFYD